MNLKNLKIILFSFAITLGFSSPLFSKIIQDDITSLDKKRFSFETVCKAITKRDSPLISKKNIHELDCMGSRVKVSKFCEKELIMDPYYLRAYVDDKSVVCVSGKKVSLKYECEKKNDPYCLDKNIGCDLIQEAFALRLRTTYTSLLQNLDKKSILHCIFEPQEVKDLINSNN